MASYPTPLRVSSPVRLLVHVPPDTWGWGEAADSPPAARGAAAPTPYGLTDYLSYAKEESDAIWMRSGPLKTPAPDVD